MNPSRRFFPFFQVLTSAFSRSLKGKLHFNLDRLCPPCYGLSPFSCPTKPFFNPLPPLSTGNLRYLHWDPSLRSSCNGRHYVTHLLNSHCSGNDSPSPRPFIVHWPRLLQSLRFLQDLTPLKVFPSFASQETALHT